MKQQRRLIKKTIKSGGSVLEAVRKLGALPVSFCTAHGPYDADSLCACYDLNRKKNGITYEESFESSFKNFGKKSGNPAFDKDIEELNDSGFCPIHGQYSMDNLCDCYDGFGNLKTDWDRKL